MTKYVDRASDVYSQNGEDGIVAAILASFPKCDRWCVEFGAWDGLHLSNSRRLIEQAGYHAVLIEADTKLCRQLVANSAAYPGVVCMCAFVGFDQETGLDVLLSKTDCPKDFDFLSVDIDGNDVHVWRAVTAYRPKLVCIEFNPTAPDGVTFEQPADPHTKWGSSLDAMKRLAEEKSYVLVAVNGANAFFVAAEVWAQVKDGEQLRSTERVGAMAPVHLFVGFDGTVLTSSEVPLVWHGIRAGAESIQILPKFLRRFPSDYSLLQRLVFGLWSLQHRARRKLLANGRSS